MVLFPKKADTPKKGLVNDSTDLKFDNQNTDFKLMGTAPFDSTKRVKAVKITKAMKDEKVYQKLRIERVNKYHKGKRDKKANEAENNKEK